MLLAILLILLIFIMICMIDLAKPQSAELFKLFLNNSKLQSKD